MSQRTAHPDYYHAALRRFEEIANDDVEMKAPISESTVFVVIDTNIVLHYLESLVQFVDDVENQGLPIVVIVPNAVTKELDGMKKEAWFSRHASSWLLQKSQERKVLKGQARNETDNRHGPPENNDERIMHCAAYFNRIGQTYLYSADKNLCIMCEAERVITILPMTRFSSRDIARRIYEDGSVNLERFTGYHKAYKALSTIVPHEPTPDEDSMDIDEEEEQSDFELLITISDARTSLHLQIVDHFTALLAELVSRINGANPLSPDGAALSIHAPRSVRSAAANEPRNQNYAEWTASQLVDHLERRKRALPAAHPYLGVFLTKPYHGPYTGSRRGEEWSPQDWRVSLNGLRRIAEAWGDRYIIESLDEIEPHIRKVVYE
ncbi:hypothetical protein PM082_005576 [Marasmius tenuissimus]|nr:hypothetical protein PM082_005576 [Marasmius tenuissimus]